MVQQSINFGACDANGMRAIDLAADTERNTKERVQRSGQVYREPPGANRHGLQIIALLERLISSKSVWGHTEVASQRRAFFGRKSNGKLEVYWPQILLELLSGLRGIHIQKAFATLDRGSSYPYVNAMNVLDNKEWTDKAEDLRSLLGLPKDKSAASHVEPQLLAYLLDRHSLIDMFEDDDDHQEFASAMPVYSLRPIITVSKPDFGPECFEFFDRCKDNFPGFDVVFHFVEDSITASLQIRP